MKYYIAITAVHFWKLQWAHLMNIFIAKASVYCTKIFCDKEWKMFYFICAIFCDNHLTMVLITPVDTRLKDASVTMNQLYVKKRKRLVSIILGFIFVFIYNMLLNIGILLCIFKYCYDWDNEGSSATLYPRNTSMTCIN